MGGTLPVSTQEGYGRYATREYSAEHDAAHRRGRVRRIHLRRERAGELVRPRSPQVPLSARKQWSQPRTPAKHAHAHAHRHGLDGERPVVGDAEVVATAAKGRGANPREPHAVGVERVARMPAPLAWVKCARTRGRETDTAAPRETDTAHARVHARAHARAARDARGPASGCGGRAAFEQLAARLVALLRSRNEAQRRLRPACHSSLVCLPRKSVEEPRAWLGRERKPLLPREMAAGTRCDAAGTRCDAARTRCDAARTRCDAARTRCDAARARCDAAKTRSDAAGTRCDAARTRCDAARTRRPSAESRHDLPGLAIGTRRGSIASIIASGLRLRRVRGSGFKVKGRG